MLAGIVFVPMLIARIGTDRFGFLSLVWVLIGYFSLFDLGLSRALTQRVAALQAAGREPLVPTAIATGMSLIGAVAILSGPLLLLLQGVLLADVVHTSGGLKGEAAGAFVWLAAGVPVVILAAGVRGVLEGQQRFAAVNAIRTPAGVAMFAAPWAVCLWSPTLQAVTAAVLLVRVLQLVGFLVLARHSLGRSIAEFRFDRGEVNELFSFGLWMTVSNVVGPILVYIDRFAISHYSDLSGVAYYSTPFDLVTRLLFVSSAVSGVMFPILSAALVADAGRVRRLEMKNYLLLTGMLGPVCLGIAIFSYPILEVWLGAKFALRSADVLSVLAIGVFLNALTTVPFSILQAMRRADITAKVHILEFPLYVVLLIWLVQDFGILGAAIAWLIRVSVDLAAMTLLAHRVRSGVRAPPA